MARSLRALGPHNRWLAGFVILNVGLAVGTLTGIEHGADWRVLERAAINAGTPDLYIHRGTVTFVWSPVAAHAVQAIVPLGLDIWRVTLVAAAMAMPTWTLRAVVLTSWPFWTDFTTGNFVTLIFLSAVWALRGSRVATFAFFALALLIPRPLLAPMGVWILWKRPEWRAPFAAMFAIHLGLVWWTGLGPVWIQTLLTTGAEFQAIPINLSPTRLIGYWWLLAGVPLAVWLFLRGRTGWAGLAISPYVWIYYLYWLLPAVNDPSERTEASRASPQAQVPALSPTDAASPNRV